MGKKLSIIVSGALLVAGCGGQGGTETSYSTKPATTVMSKNSTPSLRRAAKARPQGTEERYVSDLRQSGYLLAFLLCLCHPKSFPL